MNGYSDAFLASLQGVVPFALYFVPAILVVLLFMWLYTRVTPHNEIALIKENNTAAATAYAGAMFGFALPIASVIANAVSLIDFAVWAIVAGLVQLITFLIFRAFYPRISSRIEAGEMGPSLKLAATSVMVGLLNAAAITY